MMYNSEISSIPLKRWISNESLVAVWCTNSKTHLNAVINEIFPKWGLKYVSSWFWLKVNTNALFIVTSFIKVQWRIHWFIERWISFKYEPWLIKKLNFWSACSSCQGDTAQGWVMWHFFLSVVTLLKFCRDFYLYRFLYLYPFWLENNNCFF